jgi:tetratricopeptide (TPR) repeat protein
MTQIPVPPRAFRSAGTLVTPLIALIVLAGCASATREGQVALLIGDNAEAAAHFEAALAKNPTSVNALVGLGVARYRLESFADADRAFTSALAQTPDLPVAHLYLGLSALRRGQDDVADAEFGRFAGMGVAPRLTAYIDRTLRLLHSIPASEELRAYMADGIADQAAWAGEVTDAVNAANYARGAWFNDTRVYYVVRSCRCR